MNIFRILLTFLVGAVATSAHAQNPEAQPFPWVAVDGLGRRIDAVQELRPDKFVGVFYYIWHGAHGYDSAFNPSTESGQGPAPKDQVQYHSPYDISNILSANSEKKDWGPVHAFHHWGESRWGYYLADDEWVIRRNAQLLADAGVDVIFFDVTNGFTYRDTYMKICRIYESIRSEGNRTPQVSFMSWNGDNAARDVYKDFYAEGQYRDLWFRWRGKPLILCKSEQADEAMKSFFTIRESWAWTDSGGWFADGRDKWTWLADTPQDFGWHDSPDRPEQLSVATAQHPLHNKGKSYQNGTQPPPDKETPELGLYFAEQWKHALEVDPDFIFITQWNEWIAQRFVAETEMHFGGKRFRPGDTYFVDLSTKEFNRDIEPMAGGYSDNYYYQMVEGIRRFKGTAPLPTDGVFIDDRGDVFHRDHPGYGSAGPYVNQTGRNDIVRATVKTDGDIVIISAETAEPLTPPAGNNWMMLFLRLTESNRPHWESFHFVLNRQPLTEGTAILERSMGGWSWEEAARLPMVFEENKVSIRIPRAILAQEGTPLAFDFKWVDNMTTPGDATDWMVSGDAAPNSRFAYPFRENDKP